MTNMQNKESIARMIDILDREHVLTKIMTMLNVDKEALRATYFEGNEDGITDPKIIISGRIFHIGDIQFR